MIEIVKPTEIEKRSFEIITEILGNNQPDPETAPVVKRVIHTTADFDYRENLVFSEHAVQKGIEALRQGCHIVTDTHMAMAGINKTVLGQLGGQVRRAVLGQPAGVGSLPVQRLQQVIGGLIQHVDSTAVYIHGDGYAEGSKSMYHSFLS